MSFEDLDIDALRRRQGKKWNTFDPDVLPAWVADMDFPVAPPIRERLQRLMECSDFGYPHDDQAGRLIQLFSARMRERFQWQVDPDRVEVIADVVQGIQMCLEMYSRPGQGVSILTPIYPPFLKATAAMGRRADCCTLVPDGENFAIDPERLEASLADDTRMLLLCSPHNPTGRVFTQPELETLAELALRRDLVVVSDEIHADLALDGRRHLPFASLAPEVEARTITLTSATKAFNIAGLRCAMMVFGSAALHQAYRAGPRFTRGAACSLGMHAAEAAWSEGGDWLDGLLRHLEGNRERIGGFLAQNLPQIGFLPPQATYLAWLDCSALGLGDELWRTVLERGRLALNDGREFGNGGKDCLRLNFATSTSLLDDALERLHRALS
ncbi:MAG TPA: PatB family C-S lyase [Arenicellales bacterium]|nr:PatB family C-S lyase [Arenicellales bacterium]